MIPDSDIPGADPEAVIKQYEPYLWKFAKRYTPVLEQTGAIDMDDLVQVGRITIMDEQKKYDPDKSSFLHHLNFPVRRAMRIALGFNNSTGAPPKALAYLDRPLSEDADETLLETIADPNVLPFDEPIIEEETRRETSEQVRAAVQRLKSDKQREVVTRVWLDGQERAAAAEEMGMKPTALRALDLAARSRLARDWKLEQYAKSLPYIHVSASRFNSTWTSSVEAAVIWKDDAGLL